MVNHSYRAVWLTAYGSAMSMCDWFLVAARGVEPRRAYSSITPPAHPDIGGIHCLERRRASSRIEAAITFKYDKHFKILITLVAASGLEPLSLALGHSRNKEVQNAVAPCFPDAPAALLKNPAAVLMN